MTIETFGWDVDAGQSGEVTFGVDKVQYGDGFAQRTGQGLNACVAAWPVSLTDFAVTVSPIVDFLNRHKGARAFMWTPPYGDAALFTCGKYRVSRRGPLLTIEATFEQTFSP
ncbi:phage tail protein [Chitinasiproducens palmae]|uniref:Phage-related protein n=1 Tax=Chitinasiproducens palmae TaxID=1770053 RepID=A0A1H2PWE5_9BURK|nr:phage tail protein [Chitinasiproducens palmae]SDV51675.1 Phage-related protein [Chitinasiproducens palmae]